MTDRLNLESRGNATIIRLPASLADELAAEKVLSEIAAFIQTEKPTRLLLDFQNVKYLTSSVLANVMSVNELVSKLKIEMQICGLQPVITEVLSVTQLDKFLEIVESEQEAFAGWESLE